jgi:hypothetical protein
MAAHGPGEVAGDHGFNFVCDMLTQRFPDIEVLSRYSQSHGMLALSHRLNAASRTPCLTPLMISVCPRALSPCAGYAEYI